MNINLNLDFLYYQEEQILDGKDPNMKTYNEQEEVFDNYMISKSILKVVQVIILSYKEKYAQYKFFSTCFYDLNSPLDRPEKPKHLGKYDFYMPKEEMSRKDIEHIILRKVRDEKRHSVRYLKELELMFVEPQILGDAIEEALEGKEFSINESTENITYNIENSAISEIEVSPTKFVLRTNQDKWAVYYGGL